MKLTIFTPTYNRAYTLHRGYDGLKKQSCKDFKWLIIDDGSTDNTKELVSEWQAEDNGFEIVYVYKENGGMHTGHNKAFDIIDTELCVCIDSDDSIADNAVETILKLWDEYGNENLAAIVGLDEYFSGGIVGDDLSDIDGRIASFKELRRRGDKKYVFRTAAIKEYPKYPEYKGENLVPLGTLYFEMDQKYDFLAFNKVFANIEYMEDGSTRNIFKQYKRSPRGFGYSWKTYLKYETGTLDRFKLCMHYISVCLLSKGKMKIKESGAKIMNVFAFPAGVLLYIYILFKSR